MQQGDHSMIEDVQTTMKFYNLSLKSMYVYVIWNGGQSEGRRALGLVDCMRVEVCILTFP